MRGPIRHIAVVVPARDEAVLLPLTLASLTAATRYFVKRHAHIPVSIIVVLDSTTDNTRELLQRWPGIRTISVDLGRVGAARNAGIAAALGRHGPANELWIANTDADTEVPEHWLQSQFELAAEGADVVVGTVEPRSADIGTALMLRWLNLHQLREDHPHIHGANMGFRTDVFAALGGFKDQGLHEDRDFVAASRASGYVVIATDTCRVITSGRLNSRTGGGFADFLDKLGQTSAPEPDQTASLPAINLIMQGEPHGQ